MPVAGSLTAKKKGRTSVSRLARTETLDGYTRYRAQIAGVPVLSSEEERSLLRTYEKARRAEAPLRATEQQHRTTAAQALAAADVARAAGDATEAARLDALVAASTALAEEAAAAAAVHTEAATEASQRLVVHNLKFVMKEARKAYLRAHGRVSLDDLNMEGVNGLLDAMNRFRTETNSTKFLTYAVWYIQLYMNKLVNDTSTPVRIPEDRKAQMAEYKRAVRAIEEEQEMEKARQILEGRAPRVSVDTVAGTDGSLLDHDGSALATPQPRVRCATPTDGEVAQRLGWSLKTLQAVRSAPSAFVELDADHGEDGDDSGEGRAWHAQREVSESLPVVDALDGIGRLMRDERIVARIKEICDVREQLVLTRYYGLDNLPPVNLEEISRMLPRKFSTTETKSRISQRKHTHLCRERARLIRDSALSKLREDPAFGRFAREAFEDM